MDDKPYALPNYPATTTEMYFHAVVWELHALNLALTQLSASLAPVVLTGSEAVADEAPDDAPSVDGDAPVEVELKEPVRKNRKGKSA